MNDMYITPPRKYSWIPDIPDQRDKLFKAEIVRTALPKKVDTRKNHPSIYDQTTLGSCTGNGISDIYDYAYFKQHKEFIYPSRLFIYYGEREIEGSVNEDAGAMIRDGIKFVADKGVCKEKTWPYDVSKFAQKPPLNAYEEAINFKIFSYERVNTLTQLKQSLAQDRPVVFGFSVYESFESNKVATTGIVPIPKKKERLLGGHCVVAVGYDDDKKWVICRNSWGSKWGDRGYFYLPQAYFTKDLTDDFWSIKLVS